MNRVIDRHQKFNYCDRWYQYMCQMYMYYVQLKLLHKTTDEGYWTYSVIVVINWCYVRCRILEFMFKFGCALMKESFSNRPVKRSCSLSFFYSKQRRTILQAGFPENLGKVRLGGKEILKAHKVCWKFFLYGKVIANPWRVSRTSFTVEWTPFQPLRSRR